MYFFVDDASENPTFYADLRKPQSLNKYQYAYNNPLRWVDPDGHDPKEPEPPQDPRPVVPLTPIRGVPPLVVPGGPTTSTAKPPNDATIIEGAQRVLDTVADVTGISKLADLIRPYCPFCPQPAPAPTTEHFLSFEDIDGVTEMYVGQDILENEETLPGVYWLTYFGPWAVERIGNERFADLKAEKVESIDGGYLVQAYGSGSQAGGSLARHAETRIVSQLGKQHFFDKALVNIEALKTSPEEAELVEEKIKEHKAKKKRAK